MYRNYKIFAVSGGNPFFFLAEKDDPAKGGTLYNEDLDKLKVDIDNLLARARELHINIYDGPQQSCVAQNIKGRVTPVDGDGYDVVVVVA